MGFRIVELFILACLIVFIVNVLHYVLKVEGDGGGLFFLSKRWEANAKKQAEKKAN